MMAVIILPVHVVLASFEDTRLCWKKAVCTCIVRPYRMSGQTYFEDIRQLFYRVRLRF